MKEYKIPLSKFVKTGKDKWELREKAILADICCPYRKVVTEGGGSYLEHVIIKITSCGIKPDDLVCLNSFDGKCPHIECILHVDECF